MKFFSAFLVIVLWATVATAQYARVVVDANGHVAEPDPAIAASALGEDYRLAEILANKLALRRAAAATAEIEAQAIVENNIALREYLCRRFCPQVPAPTTVPIPGAPGGAAAAVTVYPPVQPVRPYRLGLEPVATGYADPMQRSVGVQVDAGIADQADQIRLMQAEIQALRMQQPRMVVPQQQNIQQPRIVYANTGMVACGSHCGTACATPCATPVCTTTYAQPCTTCAPCGPVCAPQCTSGCNVVGYCGTGGCGTGCNTGTCCSSKGSKWHMPRTGSYLLPWRRNVANTANSAMCTAVQAQNTANAAFNRPDAMMQYPQEPVQQQVMYRARVR